MRLLTTLRHRLRSLTRRETLDAALTDEIEFHIAQQTAELIAQGVGPADAASQARRLFGPAAVIEEHCRDHRRTRWIHDFLYDARFTVRTCARNPAFTAVAVLTLALGIGANTAFFSAAYTILFRSLPYPEPDRLIAQHEPIMGAGPVIALRDLSRTVDYAGYLLRNDVNVRLDGQVTRLRAVAATWNLLRVLQQSPARGRWFHASDERTDKAVVLSDRFWRQRLNADPHVIGRLLTLNDRPHTIIGVMPASFVFPTPETSIWIPVRIDPADLRYMWGGGALLPIGRLHGGATRDSAQAELTAAVPAIRALFPWRMPDSWGVSATVTPLQQNISRHVRPKFLALSAAALLLLLIACANVANLLLARAVRRRREFAMREALGANRARLLRQVIAENLILVIAGGLAGACVAAVIVRALPALLPPGTPRLHELAPDPALVLIAGASMIVTVAIFGAAPFLRLRSAASLTLIAVEVALSTVLLIGAGLMVRTIWQLRAVDPGVRSSGVLSARISAGPAQCGAIERCTALLDDIARTLQQNPAVRTVSWTNYAPLDRMQSAMSVAIEDHPRPPGDPAYVLWHTGATPEYFATLGIPLLEGRVFTQADTPASEPVVIVSQATAKRFWPNQSSVGKRIRAISNREWMTVVGVVGDAAQYALTGFPSWVDGVQYVPLTQMLPRTAQNAELTMLIETGERQLPPTLRNQFPAIGFSHVRTLESLRSESIVSQRSTASLLGLFAALGLLLGAIGVYGVISHRAAQRTRDIGIRMALGATPRTILSDILRETAAVTAAGCFAGLCAAYALSRYLDSLVFGITTHDTLTFALCPAVLLASALLAAALPARRAARTDPALTLRE